MRKILFLLLILTVIAGCKSKPTPPEVEKVPLTVLRFDKDLFNIDYAALEDSLPFFRKKYGEFFDIFNFKVIQIGSSENKGYADLLRGFVTDYSINKAKKECDSVFADFSPIADNISSSMSYFHHYFPKKPVPTIITYVSGFNQSLVTTDTILGIALDRYLGENHDFYKRMALPEYIRQKMNKSRIPADVVRAWLITNFTMNDSAFNLLSNIIYLGKIAYASSLLQPNAEDTVFTGLSKNEIEWCKENEKNMWTFLVEKKKLFSSDLMLIRKYCEEAPFTKDFGQESPGKAVIWIGYKIVEAYMANNPQVKLQQLMEQNDYMAILKKSKYKP